MPHIHIAHYELQRREHDTLFNPFKALSGAHH